jgi:hypothetical protein
VVNWGAKEPYLVVFPSHLASQFLNFCLRPWTRSDALFSALPRFHAPNRSSALNRTP